MKEPLVVRFEDIDKPRVMPGAQASQLADMQSLKIHPDHVEVQSANYHRHKDLFEQAKQHGKIYACDCSRADVREALRGMASAPHQKEAEYSGHCRDLNRDVNDLSSFKSVGSLAWRWRHEDTSGRRDSIVARSEMKAGTFLPGYHWACAIDDADGNYNWLVRAWDLQPAEETQSRIREWVQSLSRKQDLTRVFHTSLITKDDGQRIEKRTPDVTLAELHAIGYSSEKLIEVFKASFSSVDASLIKISNTSNRALGEARQRMTLTELGLSLSRLN